MILSNLFMTTDDAPPTMIVLYSHCIATWHAMPRSHVKLMEIGTSWGVARQ